MTPGDVLTIVLVTAIGGAIVAICAAIERRWFLAVVAGVLSVIGFLIFAGAPPS